MFKVAVSTNHVVVGIFQIVYSNIDHITLGARAPRNEWEHLRNISRSGSILLKV